MLISDCRKLGWRTFSKTHIYFSYSMLGQCGHRNPQGLKPEDPEENVYDQTQLQRSAQVLSPILVKLC